MHASLLQSSGVSVSEEVKLRFDEIKKKKQDDGLAVIKVMMETTPVMKNAYMNR